MNDGLTPAQEAYFRVLKELAPSPDLLRAMANARGDLMCRRNRAAAQDEIRKGYPGGPLRDPEAFTPLRPRH